MPFKRVCDELHDIFLQRQSFRHRPLRNDHFMENIAEDDIIVQREFDDLTGGLLDAAHGLFRVSFLDHIVQDTLQVVGQKDTPPAVASLLMSLESVFAALSGWLILRQQMSGREAVGCVLVFAAVILAQLPLSAIRAKLCRKKAV